MCALALHVRLLGGACLATEGDLCLSVDELLDVLELVLLDGLVDVWPVVAEGLAVAAVVATFAAAALPFAPSVPA